MTDEGFDRFLSQALAPEARGPDRGFVVGVQARVRLDDLLLNDRRRAVSTLAKQMLAIAALAAAIVWLLQAPAVSQFADRAPEYLFAAVIAGFSLLVATLGVSTTGTMPHARGRGARAR